VRAFDGTNGRNSGEAMAMSEVGFWPVSPRIRVYVEANRCCIVEQVERDRFL
jgi:hypothetical protein